ncbi:hypothetical protein [Actinoplanes sp. NPDC049599]|uniref:hypothetical protein n=1 Tax=Actinoplanes sp. NPDC049599 TaxID=3363903 RepID=UPI0037AEB5C9
MATGAMLATATPVAAPASAAQSGTDIGRLIQLASLGGSGSTADDMNERGDMIGQSADAAQNLRGVVWWHGRRTPTDLDIDHASPRAINDLGHIAGRVEQGNGQLFLWRRGTVTYLREPAGLDLDTADLNDRDQVIGTAYDQNLDTRAFLWQRGRLTLLPVPKGTISTAVGINNRGDVIGNVERRGAETRQAVLWRGGRMVRLGTLGGESSAAVAINDRGQVIGNSTAKGASDGRPFLWQRGRMTDLLARTTATSGRATALSDTGMITGSASWADPSRPVLWRAGTMIDIGLPGRTGVGRAINDRGDVVGLTWPEPPEGSAVPFRWQSGHTTLFPEPFGDVDVGVVGIDSHGTIGLAQETTHSGYIVLRSA